MANALRAEAAHGQRPRIQIGRAQARALGQGECGIVVTARHRATGQAVAVKSLHRRSWAADVLRETCFVAAGGGHPSLVAFRMADRGERPYPEAEAGRIKRQLLAGAEVMHRHG